MAEVKNHGASGYRRGCKCDRCRAGHRESVAQWRASRKKPPVPASPGTVLPRGDAPGVDDAAPPGVIETAMRADIAKLVGEPPWKATLSALAIYNARLLDQLQHFDRLDLVSPMQLRTLEILQRLRAVSEGAGAGDEAEAFLRDLGTA